MFPFHQLTVYHKAAAYREEIRYTLENFKIQEPIRSQLNRASLSIILNIAEGSGRFSKADRKNFFVIARGSVFECVSATDTLLFEKNITEEKYMELYKKADEISRILFSLIRSNCK